MSCSHDELFRLTATEAVALLKRGDITPLDLIDAAERRIAEVEPAINALPTLCLDRAREHARRLMRGEGREAEGEPGWLGGLPVAIKDLADVAGVRTTGGHSARRLAFGTGWARAETRWMHSRPSLARCAGQLTSDFELSMRPYRSNGSLAPPAASSCSKIG
jgi:hypothetical protein